MDFSAALFDGFVFAFHYLKNPDLFEGGLDDVPSLLKSFNVMDDEDLVLEAASHVRCCDFHFQKAVVEACKRFKVHPDKHTELKGAMMHLFNSAKKHGVQDQRFKVRCRPCPDTRRRCCTSLSSRS